MSPLLVPIPDRMKHLPRDPRGFPVPVTVLRDKSGTPQFTINDERLRLALLAQDQCHICGRALLRGRWFVGGPLSAFHERGMFFDGGMHDECAHYALRVCPWLAATRYSKRIDTGKMAPEDAPAGLVTIDRTVLPDRPAVFIALMAIGQREYGDPWPGGELHIRPTRPYRKTEFWRQGVQLSEAEGRRLVQGDFSRFETTLATKGFQAPKVVRHR